MKPYEHLNISQLKLLWQYYFDLSAIHKERLDSIGNENFEKYNFEYKILFSYNSHLELVKEELEQRKSSSLAFSVERIYELAGANRNLMVFEFFPDSEAFNKYGSQAVGHPYYGKTEEMQLISKLSNSNISHTDGKIRLVSSDEFGDLLRKDGFAASDVLGILNPGIRFESKYNEDGTKQINEIITINIDLSNDAPLSEDRLQAMLNGTYRERLEANFELEERQLLSEKERNEFRDFIYNRLKTRFEVVVRELGIVKKQLQEFAESAPEKYNLLFQMVLEFEEMDFTPLGKSRKITLNFDRFAHIFCGHFEYFYVEGLTREGTKFEYRPRDILQIVELLVDRLYSEIERNLEQLKDYKVTEYFEGKYYKLHIRKDGLLLTFHPLENKRNEGHQV